MTRILVIEDEPASQLVMHKALTKIGGFEVTVTEAVDEALALARSGEIALVVMDVALSSSEQRGVLLDGLAFTRLLKDDPAARRVPVLLATAYALPGDAERLCAACGAEGYISKPFTDSKALVDKVREMLAASAGQGT